MAVPTLVLQQLPLLSSLPAATLVALATKTAERSFAKREVVIQKDEEAKFFCFLVDGRLQSVDFTVDGREVGLSFIEPGDYFAEMGIIDGQAQPEFVIAVARSRVIFIPKPDIRPIIFGNPFFAESMCQRLSNKLRYSTVQRRILGMPNPLQRICAQLLLMAERGSDVLLVRNIPTHQELAIMINSSRETVTRAFQFLQTHDIVSRQGNDLLIVKQPLLVNGANGELDPKRGER